MVKEDHESNVTNRRIYGMKFCQIHEIKIGMLLDAEKNFPTIRIVES